MEAAEQLEFEKAALLRDKITQLHDSIGKKISDVELESPKSGRRRRKMKGTRKVPRPGKPS